MTIYTIISNAQKPICIHVCDIVYLNSKRSLTELKPRLRQRIGRPNRHEGLPCGFCAKFPSRAMEAVSRNDNKWPRTIPLRRVWQQRTLLPNMLPIQNVADSSCAIYRHSSFKVWPTRLWKVQHKWHYLWPNMKQGRHLRTLILQSYLLSFAIATSPRIVF